jgi:hypothetical protein
MPVTTRARFSAHRLGGNTYIADIVAAGVRVFLYDANPWSEPVPAGRLMLNLL